MFRLGGVGVGVRWEYGGMGISGGEERIVTVFFLGSVSSYSMLFWRRSW